jgi:predicted AAA+ superfamily ATPase
MVKRKSNEILDQLAQTFKVVAITGPRQSGKTTLVKAFFNKKPYISLENPDELAHATNDPRGFLSQFPDGAVLDEVQRTPQLFSYLQQIVDEDSRKALDSTIACFEKTIGKIEAGIPMLGKWQRFAKYIAPRSVDVQEYLIKTN